MFLSALLRLKRQRQPPPGDLILALVSDEEAGGDCGARYLVENHADQFTGIRYALGEFGGFNLNIGKKRFYPIQVSEKQACWLRGTVRGPGGHGSIPVRGGALYKLGRLLQAWSQKRLPVHITPPVRQMVSAMKSHMGGLNGFILGQLLTPALTDHSCILGSRETLFDPLLHNTVSPTVVQASDKTNVIPSEVTFHLDGRLLPGFGPEDLMRELNQLCPEEVEWEVLLFDGGKDVVDMGLFETLAAVLREADPEGIPVPMVLSGMTDGRFFARLGIQSYGFLPMQLEPGFAFTTVIHAADERIPLSAVEFGTNAIYQVIQRF